MYSCDILAKSHVIGMHVASMGLSAPSVTFVVDGLAWTHVDIETTHTRGLTA